MIKISVTKIDDKGRINLPAHFLKANNIQKGCEVIIEAIINNSDAVKLKFKGVADAKQKSKRTQNGTQTQKP